MKNLKIFFALTLVMVLTLTFSQNNFSKNYSDGYKIGDKVESFSVSNYDGSVYNLGDVNSKALVIMFWSAKCPFVQAYTDRIKELYSEFKDKDVIFWAINSNNTEAVEEVKEHAAGKNYGFPVLKDANNKIADQFAADRTPEVFVLDENKILIYHGSIDDNVKPENVTSQSLKNALEENLSGKEITVKETKSFGCTIKR